MDHRFAIHCDEHLGRKLPSFKDAAVLLRHGINAHHLPSEQKLFCEIR